MGVRFPSVQSNVLANPSVGINTETVVCVTPPLTLPLDSAVVLIFWYMSHTVGATAALCQYRLRRGATTGGALLNAGLGQDASAAGSVVTRSGFYFDNPGAAAGQQYCICCIDTASTGIGAIGDACILAFCL